MKFSDKPYVAGKLYESIDLCAKEQKVNPKFLENCMQKHPDWSIGQCIVWCKKQKEEPESSPEMEQLKKNAFVILNGVPYANAASTAKAVGIKSQVIYDYGYRHTCNLKEATKNCVLKVLPDAVLKFPEKETSKAKEATSKSETKTAAKAKPVPTGSAAPTSMTLAEAEAIVFSFGKHKGKTVKEVAKINPGYLSWAILSKTPDRQVKKAIRMVLDAAEEMSPEAEGEKIEPAKAQKPAISASAKPTASVPEAETETVVVKKTVTEEKLFAEDAVVKSALGEEAFKIYCRGKAVLALSENDLFAAEHYLKQAKS